VEGAQVGARDFTFRGGPDVIRGSDIPPGFSAVLSGHIHRAQVLDHDLTQTPLAAPVIYAGSVERTSFAERHEDKSYTVVTVGLSGDSIGKVLEIAIVPLASRPMHLLTVDTEKLGTESLADHLRRRLGALDPDSIVRVQLVSSNEGAEWHLSAAVLRELAPPSINVSLAPDRARFQRASRRRDQPPSSHS
jgi:DNA repair exonuclease SbcCD nuclease subunit